MRGSWILLDKLSLVQPIKMHISLAPTVDPAIWQGLPRALLLLCIVP